MSELRWHVAHTRPRCEKKLVQSCQRDGFHCTLPQYVSVKRYRGKTVKFLKPLFPGYLFLQLEPGQRDRLRHNQHVANLLDVPDQEEFEQQLQEILRAMDLGVEVQLAPQIKEGMRVRIKSGPLRGFEAWVQRRDGVSEVVLRLDFIGQAAAVSSPADDLEPL